MRIPLKDFRKAANLAKVKGLSGTEVCVFWHWLLDSPGYRLSPSAIANQLEIDRTAASRAVSGLFTKGVLITVNNQTLISWTEDINTETEDSPPSRETIPSDNWLVCEAIQAINPNLVSPTEIKVVFEWLNEKTPEFVPTVVIAKKLKVGRQSISRIISSLIDKKVLVTSHTDKFGRRHIAIEPELHKKIITYMRDKL